MARLAIIGASGHGKVVADIALSSGKWQEITFFDDAYPNIKKVECWDVLGTTDYLIENALEFDGIIVAIGDNKIRLAIFKKLEHKECGNIITLIHRDATVCSSVKIGAGTVVMAGAIVNAFSSLGKGCIINSNSVVEHDCVLSDGVHISPGAILTGAVSIDSCSWVGAGAIVIQQLKIGSNITIGAGSCVINDIADEGVYAGSPARKLTG